MKVTDKEALIKTRGVIGKLAPGDAQWAAKIIEPGSEKIRVLKKFALTQILKPGDVIKVSVKTVQDTTIHLSLQQEPQAEAALVALDQETGFIRAMIGGYDFVKSDYNRVIYAQRQPGSAFKPIIYAAALEHGYTPASIITDEPVTYTGGPRGDWSPENADHKFHGPTTLRKALTYSRNVVTVKLVDTVGIDNVVNFARTIGVRGELPRNLTLALGSLSTSPLELALCYSVFANGGMKIKPVAIKFITDTNGTVIESNEPEAEQVISSTTAFLITSMLESVVQRGTGWRAKALGRPVAGKTGTTNEYRDAWFVGYTTNLTAAVWVGFDDTKPLGALETGARTASPIWVSFMQNALSGPGEEFSVPEGITVQTIDPQTGLLVRDESDGVREYFKEGTEPRTYSLSPLFHRIGEQEQEESEDQDANLNFD